MSFAFVLPPVHRITRRHALGVLATAVATGGAAGSVDAGGDDDSGTAPRRPHASHGRRWDAEARRPVDRLGLAWERTYGDAGYDRLEAATAADEGALLVGQSDDPPGGRWRAWLHRTEPGGDSRWHRTFDDDWLEAALAVATVDDGFVVAGRRRTAQTAPFDAWVRRTDADGRVQWRWTNDADGDDEATAVVGGDPVRVAGTTAASDGTDVWVRAFGSGGEVERHRTYGDEHTRTVLDAAPADDGVLLAGTTRATGERHADAWLARVDGGGELAWSRSYGGERAERASAVQPTDGGAVLAGLTGSEGDGLWDVWLVGVDADGRRQWARTHGGGGADYATDLLAVDDGYVVVGASASGDRYRSDGLVLGVSTEGEYLWHRFDGGPGRDVARAVVPWTGRDDASGGTSALVAGQYSPTPDRIDAWLLGLSTSPGTPTPQPTLTPTETPSPTVPPTATPTDPPTPTRQPVDTGEGRDETTVADGPGFGVVGALAALGVGGWLSGGAARLWRNGTDRDE